MYMSSQEEVQKALRGLLVRDGVQVGGGAGYPRVEVHSWNEQAPSDKGMSLREATCVVESMSTASKGDALRMNGENLSRLAGQEPVTEHFRVIGIVPEGVFPAYCHARFPGEDIVDFMNLPQEHQDELAKYCRWQPIPVPRMKKEGETP